MLRIQPPNDLISIAIHNILSYRKDKEFYDLVKDWNKVIVINVIEFYPVTVTFQGDEIKIEQGDAKKPSLKVTMGLNTMVDIAFGRTGPYTAVLKRKMKIKGIYRIGTLLKFQKIFLGALKSVAKEPNLNYFELNKCTK